MAAFSTIALGIGAAASVAGTYMSYKSQKKAADLSEKQQALSARRSRRQAIRSAQLQRAQAMASAQGMGAMGSSGAMGGIGSLGSQLGSELGYSTQMSGLSAGITSAQQRAQMWGGVAQLGGSLFSSARRNPGFFDNLKPNKAPIGNFGGLGYSYPDQYQNF